MAEELPEGPTAADVLSEIFASPRDDDAPAGTTESGLAPSPALAERAAEFFDSFPDEAPEQPVPFEASGDSEGAS